MIWLYWTLRRRIAQRRSIASAMREMRRNDYVAGWHDLIEKRRNWNAL